MRSHWLHVRDLFLARLCCDIVGHVTWVSCYSGAGWKWSLALYKNRLYWVIPCPLGERNKKADDTRRHHFWDSARGEVPVFWASRVSHEERDPPVRLQRLVGTEDALLNGSPGCFFFLGKVLFVCFPSISCGNTTDFLGVKGCQMVLQGGSGVATDWHYIRYYWKLPGILNFLLIWGHTLINDAIKGLYFR